MRGRHKGGDAVQEAEQAESDSVSRAKHKVAVERLRKEWADEDYNPLRHLMVARVEGDCAVLASFAWREKVVRMATIGGWMAYQDCHDLIGVRNKMAPAA